MGAGLDVNLELMGFPDMNPQLSLRSLYRFAQAFFGFRVPVAALQLEEDRGIGLCQRRFDDQIGWVRCFR
jgi:hypothetical protein